MYSSTYSMEDLRIRCTQILEEARQKQDESHIARMLQAQELLTDPDIFKKLTDAEGFYLLLRLKFKWDEAWQVLQQHNPIRVYVGRLHAKFPNGTTATSTELYLAPSIESYGYIYDFYKLYKGQDYYSLNWDSRWSYDPELERMWDRTDYPVSVELIREVTGQVNPRLTRELNKPVTV